MSVCHQQRGAKAVGRVARGCAVPYKAIQGCGQMEGHVGSGETAGAGTVIHAPSLLRFQQHKHCTV